MPTLEESRQRAINKAFEGVDEDRAAKRAAHEHEMPESEHPLFTKLKERGAEALDVTTLIAARRQGLIQFDEELEKEFENFQAGGDNLVADAKTGVAAGVVVGEPKTGGPEAPPNEFRDYSKANPEGA